MFIALHANAYFSVGGEVFLYFIVRVEVVKIQIWFELKLVQNLEKVWKLKSLFSNFLLAIGRIPPSRPSLASHPSPAWGLRRDPTRPSSSLACSPAGPTTLPGFPDPLSTRSATTPVTDLTPVTDPNSCSSPGLIHPLCDFSVIFMIWNRITDRMARSSNSLRVDTGNPYK
jgi:hypothetical protein